jgi:hypothetical protein
MRENGAGSYIDRVPGTEDKQRATFLERHGCTFIGEYQMGCFTWQRNPEVLRRALLSVVECGSFEWRWR